MREWDGGESRGTREWGITPSKAKAFTAERHKCRNELKNMREWREREKNGNIKHKLRARKRKRRGRGIIDREERKEEGESKGEG